MEALLQRITALATGVKLGILVALVVAIGGIYYYNWYDDILTKQKMNGETIVKRTAEETDYKKRVEQFKAYTNEVAQLREEAKELLRILPQSDDIEQFIENVNAQVELAGLTKVSSTREDARQEEIYYRIPIRMSLVGTYHQINKFFKSISEMQRIVTIADLVLNPTDNRGPTATGPLKADFVAYTFQLVAPRVPSAPLAPIPGAAAPGGAAPASAPPVHSDSMRRGAK